MGCGCLIALLVWLSPRFALVIMQLFTDRLALAMDSFLMGALGFVFLPYTTVFYALCYAPLGGVSGFGWLLVALGLPAGPGFLVRRRQAGAEPPGANS